MASLSCMTFDTFYPRWRDDLLNFGWLDLSDLHFVQPGGVLCVLIGIIETVKRLSRAVLRIPSLSQVRSYLARIGFFELLPDHVDIEPALTQEEIEKPHIYKGHCDSVLEMTPIASRGQLREVVECVRQTTERELNYDQDLSNAWAVMLSEIGDNALKHSGESQFIGLMQAFGQGQRRRVELAIGDNGCGVANSLASNERYDHLVGRDGDAIVTALQSGASRLEGVRLYPGNGLPSVQETTKRHGGSLDVRSGSAKHCAKGDTDGWTIDTPFLAGTQVVVSLPAIY